MARRYWTCPRCKYRNENSRSPKCLNCRENSRPKLRVAKTAETLRDDNYAFYKQLNADVHGVGEVCAICGAERQERKLDRDHDHKTGQPRGLLCVPCNKKLGAKYTVTYFLAAAAYLRRVESFYTSIEREAA